MEKGITQTSSAGETKRRKSDKNPAPVDSVQSLNIEIMVY
jgi:hypothetical protein